MYSVQLCLHCDYNNSLLYFGYECSIYARKDSVEQITEDNGGFDDDYGGICSDLSTVRDRTLYYTNSRLVETCCE
jgi:hypothetical protein